MKRCPKCKKYKKINLFHKDKQSKTGYKSYCKKCSNGLSCDYYEKNKEKVSNRIKKYQEKNSGYLILNRRRYYKENKKKIFAKVAEYRKKNKDNIEYKKKRVARQMVYLAIKNGEIVKSPCIICGNKKVEAHHHNGYSKKHCLDIVFLCSKHHGEAEKNIKN